MAVKKPEKQKKTNDLEISKTKGAEAVKGGTGQCIKIPAR